MVTQLPVAEAAQALGISVSALRRGLKSGRYHGERQSTPQGFVWLVEVDGDRVGEVRVSGDRRPGRRRPPTEAVSQEPTAAPGMALQAQRARDMAEFTERLQAPLLARLEAQAERIGRLEAELETARTQLAGATDGQAETREDAAPGDPERRPWWNRAWRLVAGD